MNGKEEYCQFCWACYQHIKCIAKPEEQGLLCEKAKARMGIPVKESREREIKTDGESTNIKKYLKYIPQRIAYLKMLMGDIPSNEYKFYCSLKKAIEQWGKAHVIFYGCLCGKITTKQAKSLYGVSERTLFRMMREQKKHLIKYIEEQEKLLSEKYPFIPMTDIFEE